MTPDEHIDWFDDNVHWFENLPLTSLGNEVPNCPGWSVEQVIVHLALGLGLSYPYALRAPEDSTPEQAWADVPHPKIKPTGKQAINRFAKEMDACVALFRDTDPDKPCWTYDDSSRARFWFRRAAIETALHRIDVAEALGLRAIIIKPARLADAIEDAVEFALPLAAELSGQTPAAMTIRVSGSDQVLTVGEGSPEAEITADGDTMLAALWGRHVEQVEIEGDRSVADAWLGLVESSFGGR